MAQTAKWELFLNYGFGCDRTRSAVSGVAITVKLYQLIQL